MSGKYPRTNSNLEILVFRDLNSDAPLLGQQATNRLMQSASLHFFDPWRNLETKDAYSDLYDKIVLNIRNRINTQKNGTFLLMQGVTGRFVFPALRKIKKIPAGIIWLNPMLQIKSGIPLLKLFRFFPALIPLWKKFFLPKYRFKSGASLIRHRLFARLLSGMSLDRLNWRFSQFQYPVLMLCSDNHKFQSSRYAEDLNQELGESALTRFVHPGFDLINEEPDLVCKYIDDFLDVYAIRDDWRSRWTRKFQKYGAL